MYDCPQRVSRELDTLKIDYMLLVQKHLQVLKKSSFMYNT